MQSASGRDPASPPAALQKCLSPGEGDGLIHPAHLTGDAVDADCFRAHEGAFLDARSVGGKLGVAPQCTDHTRGPCHSALGSTVLELVRVRGL